MMDPLFEVHKLNEEGLGKAREISHIFNFALDQLKQLWLSGDPSLTTLTPLTTLNKEAAKPGGREQALVRTYLELACFYAKKAMAVQEANQVLEEVEAPRRLTNYASDTVDATDMGSKS